MDISAAPESRFSTHLAVAGDGDPDARVAAIYVAHYQHLVGLASMLAGGRASGEEVAQETFMIALEHERRKPGYLTDPVWPWLRITAVRLAGRFRTRLLREILQTPLRAITLLHRGLEASNRSTCCRRSVACPQRCDCA